MNINQERVKQAVSEIKKYVKISDIFKEMGFLDESIERGEETYISCPFHLDKTPSLGINNVKGVWHCFSCGKGGDAANAYKELLLKCKGIKISYYAAIDQLIHDIPALNNVLPFSSVESLERNVINKDFKINRFNPNTVVKYTMNDVYRFMQKNDKVGFNDIAQVVDFMIENMIPENILDILKNSKRNKNFINQSSNKAEITVSDLLNSLDW